MHDVSNAINILDPSNTIDAKICGTVQNDGTGQEGKCTAGSGGSSRTSLSKIFGVANTDTYKGKETEQVDKFTSGKISTDMVALNREEKGKVSSAFAKAHEGAEIPV